MFKKIATTLSVVALLAIPITGCDDKTPSNKPKETAGQYETIKMPQWDAMSFKIHWVGRTEISEKCQELGTSDGDGSESGSGYAACSKVITFTNGTHSCEMYIVSPEDFNDEARLEILGHELFHCLGATHQ